MVSLEKIRARGSLLSNIAVAFVFLAGAVWRIVHITRLHDPRKYIYSDMLMYVNLAKKFAAGKAPSIGDVTHPPGASELFGFFYARDPSFWSLVWLQAIIAVVAPLVIAALAWSFFGKPNAKLTLIVTSVYFPFVDYGGYFLSEIYCILLIPLTLVLFVWATRQKKIWQVVLLSLVAGFVFSLGLSMKLVVLPAVFCFVAAYWLLYRGPARKITTIAAIGMFVASAPLQVAMAERCTTASKGNFCLSSNKSGADFLLGHYGRIQGLAWKPPGSKGYVSFGSPSSYQRGYRDVPDVPFALHDNEKNKAEAWKWIRAHKAQAVLLSFEHVYDTFVGSLPWPGTATSYWGVTYAFHFLFLAFVLVPSLFVCFERVQDDGFWEFLRGPESLLWTPLFGVAVAVFIATGEPRYRIPYDSLLIILAVECGRRFVAKRMEAARSKKSAPPIAGEPTAPIENAAVSEHPPAQQPAA